jgi:hypothetical protein
MSALKQDDGVEQRLKQLERRLAATIRVVNENESRLGRLEVTHPEGDPCPRFRPSRSDRGPPSRLALAYQRMRPPATS